MTFGSATISLVNGQQINFTFITQLYVLGMFLYITGERPDANGLPYKQTFNIELIKIQRLDVDFSMERKYGE